MASTFTPLMTPDDLLNLPDDGRQHELVNERLITTSLVSSRQAIVAAEIGGEIGLFALRHAVGYVGVNWGFHLRKSPDTVRAPDYAFVRAGRIPAEGVPPGFWPGAPDLAVEVISPSDRFTDVMDKVDEYLASETRMVVVVDPESRITRVFRPGQPTLVLGPDGVLDGEDVLPSFRLELAGVWV